MGTKLQEKIYSKDFNIEFKGYNVKEVDAFFDEINEDLEAIEKENEAIKKEKKNLEKEILDLQEKIKDLNLEISNIKAKKDVSATSSANFSNIEYLNRMSKMENKIEEMLAILKENNKS